MTGDAMGGPSDELVEAIERAKPRASHDVFLERIGELLREVGGLLDPETAALLVLDELGLDHDPGPIDPLGQAELTPDSLEAGLDGILLQGSLRHLAPTRTFGRSDGSRGFVTTARVETEGGSFEVTLWDDHIRTLMGVPPGSRVRLEGLYPKERHGQIELHTGRQARIDVLDSASV